MGMQKGVVRQLRKAARRNICFLAGKVISKMQNEIGVPCVFLVALRALSMVIVWWMRHHVAKRINANTGADIFY